jgi:ketosteroid isomerase-like protein
MTSSPAEIVTEFISKVGTPDADAYWGEAAVLEVPFAPDPWPTKISGRAAVLEYMGGVHTVLSGWSMGIDTLYDAGEGTIIVEMHGAGTVVATGKPYKQDYIAVLKVANEKVDLWREYSNPLPVFEAFGNSETVSA